MVRGETERKAGRGAEGEAVALARARSAPRSVALQRKRHGVQFGNDGVRAARPTNDTAYNGRGNERDGTATERCGYRSGSRGGSPSRGNDTHGGARAARPTNDTAYNYETGAGGAPGLGSRGCAPSKRRGIYGDVGGVGRGPRDLEFQGLQGSVRLTIRRFQG